MAIIFTTMLLHESGVSLDPLKPLGACFLRTALQRAVPPQVENIRIERSSVAVYLQLYERWSLIEDQSTSAHRAHISIRFTVSDPFINLAL